MMKQSNHSLNSFAVNSMQVVGIGLILLLAPSCSTVFPHHAEAKAAETPESVKAQEKSIEEWKESRSQILRTFAFRALERNLTNESQDYLQQACDLNPNDAQSHATLARLFLTENDAEASLAYAQQGMEATPGNLDLSLVYAAALAETDQIGRATEELEKATDWEAIARSPELARAMLLHYASTGGLEEARKFVARMEQTHPNSPYTFAMLGDLFLAAGDVMNAAEAYMSALELDPSLPTPRIITEELSLANGTSANPILVAAISAEEQGDFPGAERLYLFLMKSIPENPDVGIGLARVLWHQDRLDEANDALALIDSSSLGWREQMLIAKIAIEREDWQVAHGSLLIATKLRPGLQAADLLLAHVRQELTK